ncbi:MAG: magnesium/cobalt efflux protein, partial [bacterium]|nr:magnesium/cobalt efflux protein [bacterium]
QEEWDTVGGLVLALAGRVPAVGEVLSTEGVEFLVKEVLGHRVSEVRVRRGGGGLRAAAVG